MKPYIGITGFRTFEQVQAMLETFNNAKPTTKGKGSQRVLHVGVMTSYNTLHGNRSRYTGAFPKNNEIADIFGSAETYNCLHYAAYSRVRDVAASLMKAIALDGRASTQKESFGQVARISIQSIGYWLEIISCKHSNAYRDHNNRIAQTCGFYFVLKLTVTPRTIPAVFCAAIRA